MKRDAPMDVEVRIFGPSKNGKELANASVTLNGCFAIHGIQIKEGRNGPFVSMPRREVKGEWKDYCFPCTKEFKQQFNGIVLDAYQQKLSQTDGMQADEAPPQEAEETQVAPQMTM